ncbi:MAG: chromosome segregation protein SMC [Ferrovum sp.]|nr:chromosome segregation protein SMC [Ferrovum sp.]NDU86945.1 chromosome segregation protein SMC [Ferrovum sp.]
MQLKQIKLAGFKSFADAVQIPVSGRLVGVVGPNGCGKSNVIDAVRWVLGESQARHLRGESLEDVIFGGSAQRKSQGRASVELVFDNYAGRAPGIWASYAEVAVKRVLTRTGVSRYFINDSVVRRRDVQDVFLGTGLGPRSYAIIEQGMISRIIESRPEEIRVFLEEAAGISRYRERRRESLQRLDETRPHLERTREVLGELARQVDKVKSQAAQAIRWRELQTQRQETQNRLNYGRQQEAEAERDHCAEKMHQEQQRLEQLQTDHGLKERVVEVERQVLRHQHDAWQDLQGSLYQANHVLTQLESRLQGMRAERQRLVQDLTRMGESLERERLGLVQEVGDLERLEQALKERSGELEASALRSEAARQQSEQQRAILREARRTLEEHRRAEIEIDQGLNRLLGEQAASVRALEQGQGRLQRLDVEAAREHVPNVADRAYWEERLRECAVSVVIAQAAFEFWERCQVTCRERQLQLRTNQERMVSQRTKLEGALHGLLQLQQGMQLQVGEGGWVLAARACWDQCRVSSPWERGVEALLGERLQGLPWSGSMNSFELLAEEVRVFYESSAKVSPAAVAWEGLLPLSHFVEARDEAAKAAIDNWLHGVFVVPSTSALLAWQGPIPDGVRLISPEGYMRDAHSWMRCDKEDAAAGILARAREVDRLRQELSALSGPELQGLQQLQCAEEGWIALTQSLRLAEQHVRHTRETMHRAEVALTRVWAEWNHWEQRQQQAQQERIEMRESLEREQARWSESQGSLIALQARQGQQKSLTEQWRQGVADREREVEKFQQKGQCLEREYQEIRFRLHGIEERRRQLVAIHEERLRRVQQGEAEVQQRQLVLAELEDSDLVRQLEQAVNQQQGLQGKFDVARRDLGAAEERLRTEEEGVLRLLRDQEPVRVSLQQWQLRHQEARLIGEQARQSLSLTVEDELQLAEWWGKAPDLTELPERNRRLDRQIEALGGVNLAAVEELAELHQRQDWLTNQVADLEQAVKMLESAVHTIDREIRVQLKETVVQVENEFSRLFRELFGGGIAELRLTGEDILEAGVQIIAQPPGKKTNSLYLLSGGEKALTALALIFSLFQRNPAPFCMLDEVDAPLDDVNTERFVRLVKKMSERTQFLFITHNKIAMEMAQQLVGITMAESGVSRMVAVDVDEALRWAEQGTH